MMAAMRRANHMGSLTPLASNTALASREKLGDDKKWLDFNNKKVSPAVETRARRGATRGRSDATQTRHGMGNSR